MLLPWCMKAAMLFILFLLIRLHLTGFKEYPMEIAEVASMAMELFSMDHWDVFFDDEEELKEQRTPAGKSDHYFSLDRHH